MILFSKTKKKNNSNILTNKINENSYKIEQILTLINSNNTNTNNIYTNELNNIKDELEKITINVLLIKKDLNDLKLIENYTISDYIIETYTNIKNLFYNKINHIFNNI